MSHVPGVLLPIGGMIEGSIRMVRYVDLIKDTANDMGSKGPAASPFLDTVLNPHGAGKKKGSDPDDDNNLYLVLRDNLQIVRQSVIEGRPFEIDSLQDLVSQILDRPQSVEHMYRYTSLFGHEEDYTASHSINTLIYSLKVGMGLEYERQALLELGLAALLHDVGMFRVPDAIIRKSDSLTESEVAIVQRHPETGRDILSAWDDRMPALARTAYDHHEREDGSGYPRGLRGDQISECAKIVGLTSTYEAMTHDRPHRRALSLRELIATRNREFSAQLMKVFLEQISFYPIGSYVRLNNRTLGKVIATNDGQPMRPVIQILVDVDGNRITEEKILNLKGNSILWVSGIVREEEIPQP
jgi:HD-GYP domain-containing protein (c-di-GMP phosphodiesterase class II)